MNDPIPVSIKIRRYNPESTFGERAYWQTYDIVAKPTDRVLDALVQIKDDQDGTLTFRRSCGHGICGSDAIRINGQNKLACQTLLRDVINNGLLGGLSPSRRLRGTPIGRGPITIEPIKGLPVIRDLVVDMEPFFAQYRSVLPFLITAGEPHEPDRERLQSPAEHTVYDDTTKCILCAACTTSCPVFWVNGEYVGPAAMVNAHRFIFDSRDTAGEQRLDILNDENGVWRCRTAYNCTQACPRGIEVTKAIADIKRAELAEAL